MQLYNNNIKEDLRYYLMWQIWHYKTNILYLYFHNIYYINYAPFLAVTWKEICWHLCPRSWQPWSSCHWCMYHSHNLEENTHTVSLSRHLTCIYAVRSACVWLSVCIYRMFVSTQGPEQQQHQHIGPVHLQQHDSTSHTVSVRPCQH